MERSQMTDSAERLLRALLEGLRGDRTEGGLSVRADAGAALAAILVRRGDSAPVEAFIKEARRDLASDVGPELATSSRIVSAS